jgi:hypothetical protein
VHGGRCHQTAAGVGTRPHRIRSQHPLVRANGAKWTLVGWTVGTVLLLTDALPGLAADISGEPRLQEPLAVLTAAAEHAAR